MQCVFIIYILHRINLNFNIFRAQSLIYLKVKWSVNSNVKSFFKENIQSNIFSQKIVKHAYFMFNPSIPWCLFNPFFQNGKGKNEEYTFLKLLTKSFVAIIQMSVNVKFVRQFDSICKIFRKGNNQMSRRLW